MGLELPEALETLVNSTGLSLTVKAVCLLILVNFGTQCGYKISEASELFALNVLKTWKAIEDES